MGNRRTDIGGRLIDLLAVFALLAGTATTFSVATPLMASAINALFHINLDRNAVTIVILLITCFVYTYSLLHGFRGIGFWQSSASICFSGYWRTCCCSADRRGILSRRDFHRWDG